MFDVKQTLLEDENPSTFSLRGGQLGCDSITYDDGIDLQKGTTYLAIFMPILDSQEQPSGRLNLTAAWPVDDKGIVHTTSDGDLTIDQVTAGLQKGIETPPPGDEPLPTSLG